MKNVSILMVFLCFLALSCSESRTFQDPVSQKKYEKLMSDYSMENVTDPETKLKAEKLKAIESLEELEEVLVYIKSMRTEGFTDFSVKLNQTSLIKTRSESGGGVVVISGSNSDGRVDVHLDTGAPAVVTSAFYNTGFWDTFIGYNHLSGGASKAGSKINFTANGEIIVKIIWQGIELKRIPTTTTGYYDVQSQKGEITNM